MRRAGLKIILPLILLGGLFGVDAVPAHAALSPISITMSSYDLQAGQSATVTFTFPTAPASFTTSDISAPNGTISNLAVTGNPLVYTATFTPNNGLNVSSNSITVSGVASSTTYGGIGSWPTAIAFDGTNMWVTAQYTDSVTKVTSSGATTTYSGLGGWPSGIAFDGTNMWTANYYDNSVSKITPTGATTTYSGTGANPSGIAFDGTNMWVTNQTDNSVSKITPTGTITTYANVGWNPVGIAFDGTNMWTANVAGGTVTKITSSGATTTYSGVGSGADAIAFDGTNMWVTNIDNNSVSKVTPSGTVTTYTGTGSTPKAIAFDGTNMWTANYGDGSVTEITPSGSMITYPGVANAPLGIAFDGTNMWTANAAGNSVSKIIPMATATSSNYVIDTVVSTPPATTNTGGTSGGGSVTQQVANLLAMGNTGRAAQLEAQWPQLFGTSATPSPLSVSASPLAAVSPTTTAETSVLPEQSSPFTRNLQRGMSGSDVTALQEFLIQANAGAAAKALAAAGTSKYFGSFTKAAVIEYQEAHDISPALGNFGPITRAYVASHS